MDVFPKFIVEDGNLIICKCKHHRDLATNHSKVKGGGWFSYDDKNKTFTLFGSSDQFGRARFLDIKNCIDDGRVYTNKSCSHSIVKQYNFLYDNGTETVPF